MSGAVTTKLMNPDAVYPTERVIALYEDNNCAHLARDALIGAGVPRGAVHVIQRPASGWLAAIGSLFAPSEHAATYDLPADHAHAMVVLVPDAATDRNRAMQVLASTTSRGYEPRVVRAKPPV